MRRIAAASLVAFAGLAVPAVAAGQAPAPVLAWEAAKYFRYDIENVAIRDLGLGSYAVRVIFAVVDPTAPPGTPPWDIKTAPPYQPAALPAPATTPAASLTLDIGWDPSTDFTNTGSENLTLTPLPTPGRGAALVVQVRDLHKAGTGARLCTNESDCPGIVDRTNRFWVEKIVSPIAFAGRTVTHGRVALEGRPVCYGLDVCTGTLAYANIPVTSATADFSLRPADPQRARVANTRRAIVDIGKCKGCHDGGRHGDTIVPKLALHGGNRNENLDLCVMCHNANQTDVPYRTAGAETPVDFKSMVHSIHAGGFRESPFVVIGRNGSVNDYADVRFPSSLRNCLTCHVESGGRGSYELPLAASVLGTTIATDPQNRYTLPLSMRMVDVDPANDRKVSPTAAVCSACHDKAEVKSHMTRRGGASFATTQAALDASTVRERCVTCHGAGKSEDVKRAHEVGRASSGEHDD